MMRLNPAPRLNLREGMRVQSDINGNPDEVYLVCRLFSDPEAQDGLAVYAERYSDGRPAAPTTTAAAWFWPEGILQAIPEPRTYRAEKYALRGALLDMKNTAERILAGLDS